MKLLIGSTGQSGKRFTIKRYKSVSLLYQIRDPIDSCRSLRHDALVAGLPRSLAKCAMRYPCWCSETGQRQSRKTRNVCKLMQERRRYSTLSGWENVKAFQKLGSDKPQANGHTLADPDNDCYHGSSSYEYLARGPTNNYGMIDDDRLHSFHSKHALEYNTGSRKPPSSVSGQRRRIVFLNLGSGGPVVLPTSPPELRAFARRHANENRRRHVGEALGASPLARCITRVGNLQSHWG